MSFRSVGCRRWLLSLFKESCHRRPTFFRYQFPVVSRFNRRISSSPSTPLDFASHSPSVRQCLKLVQAPAMMHDVLRNDMPEKLIRRAWKAYVNETLHWINDGDVDQAPDWVAATVLACARFHSNEPSEGKAAARGMASLLRDPFILYVKSSSKYGPVFNTHQQIVAAGDMKRPYQWYPKVLSRLKKREIFYHVGPTNSGKTRAALEVLVAADAGVYCGPLRLLALEVYEFLNGKDPLKAPANGSITCSLLTGQERDIIDSAAHISCTVEMLRLDDDGWNRPIVLRNTSNDDANSHMDHDLYFGVDDEDSDDDDEDDDDDRKGLHEPVSATRDDTNSHRNSALHRFKRHEYKVAVIDEIQMLGDSQRGWAWTRALLGVNADQVHLCGDESALNIVKQISETTKERLTVKHYDRLSPLVVEDVAVGSLDRISAGDCVIAFSRRGIHFLKESIQRLTKHRCCTIYGSLPAETRRHQSQCFNQVGNGFDVLVASDAVGMGLNLNIQRIVFSSVEKFDGDEQRRLTASEIRQIAGRAGRWGSSFSVGLVNALRTEDLAYIRGNLSARAPLPGILKASLFPSYSQLSFFASTIAGADDSKTNKIPLNLLLERFSMVASLDPLYCVSRTDDIQTVAVALESIPMPLRERWLFCLAPVRVREDVPLAMLKSFAKDYAKGELVKLSLSPGWQWEGIAHAEEFLWMATLPQLEVVHHVIELYVWLSFRFSNAFVHHQEANLLRKLTATLVLKRLEQTQHLPRTEGHHVKQLKLRKK